MAERERRLRIHPALKAGIVTLFDITGLRNYQRLRGQLPASDPMSGPAELFRGATATINSALRDASKPRR